MRTILLLQLCCVLRGSTLLICCSISCSSYPFHPTHTHTYTHTHTPPTCLSALQLVGTPLLVICEMMKLMAAEVLAMRAGDTVTGAGGCARNLGGPLLWATDHHDDLIDIHVYVQRRRLQRVNRV